MEIVIVLLRLIHIVTAVTWFGLGVCLVLLNPALNWLGEQRYYTELAIYTRSRVVTLFPVISGVATLAGILLYATGSSNNFSSTGNMVLGTGALFGFISAMHGGGITGRLTKAYSQALTENVTPGQPIPADKLNALNALVPKLSQHMWISVVLTTIALVAMASARYL